MSFPLLILFAFFAGLTISGLTSSTIELVTGRPIAFETLSPHRRRLWVCIGLAAIAGPFVIGNEAMQGLRRGSLSLPVTWAAFAAAALWSVAIGIVATRAMAGIKALLLAPIGGL